MEGKDTTLRTNTPNSNVAKKPQKPPFKPAQDDSKPLLQDPILRSDPIESEEAVLRLPPYPRVNFKTS